MGLTQITTGGVDDNINIDSNTLKVDGTNNRVGIGTSSPGFKLEVNSGTSDSVALFESSDTTARIILRDNGSTSGGYVGVATEDMFFHTNGTERLRIDSSGRVGIGTSSLGSYSSAANNLVVQDTAGEGGITIVSTTTGASNIFFADTAGATQGQIKYQHSGDYMRFYTNGTERLRINSSGKVGIATTSPTFPLQVETSATGTTSGSNGVILVQSKASGRDAHIRFGDNVNATARVGYLSNSLYAWVNGAERLRIDSSGRVGIGTTSPGVVGVHVRNSSEVFLRLDHSGTNTWDISNDSNLKFARGGTERMRIDSSGNVGIGTSSPDRPLHVQGTSSDTYVRVGNSSGGSHFGVSSGGDVIVETFSTGKHIRFLTSGAAERFRINSQGRLSGGDALNPTGDADAKFLTINANYNGNTAVNITGTSGNTSQSGTYALRLRQNVDNNQGNSAILRIDHTNPAGASGGEIVQIFSNAGNSTAQKSWVVHRDGKQAINRPNTDGTILELRQNNNLEGTITVSGSTVSYNGGHLARWSQLEGGAERTEILRGSVLSNLDEMCEWIKPDTEELLWTQEDLDMYLLNGDEGLPGGAQVGDVKEPATSGVQEDNDQLNRMKVSDVEGDVNVSGVFQCWDDDDDTYTNDFYCAMTGDFVIRIAQGTTVARGDLLMSAGDGTAKPQDDDIVRSKTIAKVTSTTVSTTYSDGSYCVPCVLMAC